ncbi:unnamed protein product [Strongylus vulgaris]|uniref:Uncharacterized protein n=1 Tax=Strongylus vulgaris TaxID=40348 RepID=A0A3P7JHF3_STRVU|nr:unnamed protein product [Strongylus vulgaris]
MRNFWTAMYYSLLNVTLTMWLREKTDYIKITQKKFITESVSSERLEGLEGRTSRQCEMIALFYAFSNAIAVDNANPVLYKLLNLFKVIKF